MDPGDVLGDAVHARVVLGAGERRGVALDADDVCPVVVGLLSCEGNCVTAGACEHVDYDAGLVVMVVCGGGGFAGEIVCYLSGGTRKRRRWVSEFEYRGWEREKKGEEEGKGQQVNTYRAMGSGVTPNQASSVRWMS